MKITRSNRINDRIMCQNHPLKLDVSQGVGFIIEQEMRPCWQSVGLEKWMKRRYSLKREANEVRNRERKQGLIFDLMIHPNRLT